MSETLVLCGCSHEEPGGQIRGEPGCQFCEGRGQYRVRCEACCDTGFRWGLDVICDCPAGLPYHAKTEPGPESLRLAREFAIAFA